MDPDKAQKQHENELARQRTKRKVTKELKRKQDKTFWIWFIAIVVCAAIAVALVLKTHRRSAVHDGGSVLVAPAPGVA
jgi:hypothetical protein